MSQQTIFQKVALFLSSVLSPGSSIVVAVSGGADSVALLFLLHELQEMLGIKKLVVAHVNYGLRGNESDEDEKLVCRHVALLQLPFFVKRLQGHALTEPGMENWARDERYAFLTAIRAQTGCTVIATGHTLDDQAETVVMRIMRGTGLNGMRGIAAMRDDGVVRPLLSVRKRELVDWLNGRTIAYRYDSSNSDRRFLRNRIRHDIFPLLEECSPGAVGHFAACAFEAQKQWRLQQNGVDEWIRDNYYEHTADAFRIRKTGAGIRDSASVPEALRQLFVKHGITPDRYHIEAVVAAITAGGSTLLLPDGWSCRTGENYLYIEKKRPDFSYALTIPGECTVREEMRQLQITVEPSVPENLDHGKLTVFISGDVFGASCVYRSITSDDLFVPFGRKRAITVFQFLSKHGMQQPDREHCGVLATHDNRPIWIPGVRLDDRFRITPATKKVIKVQSSSIF